MSSQTITNAAELDYFADYLAFLSDRPGSTAGSVVGIVSGETAAQMLTNSARPELLSFQRCV